MENSPSPLAHNPEQSKEFLFSQKIFRITLLWIYWDIKGIKNIKGYKRDIKGYKKTIKRDKKRYKRDIKIDIKKIYSILFMQRDITY